MPLTMKLVWAFLHSLHLVLSRFLKSGNAGPSVLKNTFVLALLRMDSLTFSLFSISFVGPSTWISYLPYFSHLILSMPLFFPTFWKISLTLSSKSFYWLFISAIIFSIAKGLFLFLLILLFFKKQLFGYNLQTLKFTHLKCMIQCFLVNLKRCATIITIQFG